jgi:hypothetical protein
LERKSQPQEEMFGDCYCCGEMTTEKAKLHNGTCEAWLCGGCGGSEFFVIRAGVAEFRCPTHGAKPIGDQCRRREDS